MDIRIHPDVEPVRANLARAKARLGNLSPVMAVIGEIVVASVQRNFREQRGPDGMPWRPSVRALAEGGQTLVLSGRLRRSAGYRSGANRVEVGTNVAYAAPLHFGAAIPPRTIRPRHKRALFWPGAAHPVSKVEHPGAVIPARPFLGVRQEDWGEINSAVLAFIGG